MIRTHRLRLVPATIAHFEAMQRGDEELGRLLRAEPAPGWEGSPEHRPAIAEGGAAFLRDNPTALGWWTYFFVHQWDVRLIGVGGFKGEPANGDAEIGYALAPGYRGQGLGLEAATALRDFAFADARVERVIAHTLPEPNESNRLLEKLGMRFDGAVADPDDGEIWRWSVERRPSGGRVPVRPPGPRT